jgi:hypothetical protein
VDQKSKFRSPNPSPSPRKSEELSKSLTQDLSPESVLMPPVSLVDRKYNNLSKIKFSKAQKDLKFPMNPAFISDPRFSKLPPLQDLITFCCNNNISFSEEERRFYNIGNAMKNHTIWFKCLKKLYDTNEKDLVDTIVEFLEMDLSRNLKIHRMKNLKKANKKMSNKNAMMNINFFSKNAAITLKNNLSPNTSRHKNITSILLPRSIRSMSKDTNINTPNPLVQVITDQNYTQIKRQIDQLQPAQIDQLMQTKNPEEVKMNTKTIYDRQTKMKNSAFKSLNRKFDEPLQLNTLKSRRARNQSRKAGNQSRRAGNKSIRNQTSKDES